MTASRAIRNGVVALVAGDRAVAALNKWDQRADRYWHRASSGLTLLTVATALGWPWPQRAAALAIGVTFGGGRLSPDVDLYAWWRTLDRWVPDELLGNRGPLAHHGITHTPWVPLTVTGAVLAVAPSLWLLWLPPLAWVAHDLGDMLIGWDGTRHPDGAPAGVPIFGLWWGHVGLGRFQSGGPLCRALTVVCWVASGVLLVGGAL